MRMNFAPGKNFLASRLHSASFAPTSSTELGLNPTAFRCCRKLSITPIEPLSRRISKPTSRPSCLSVLFKKFLIISQHLGFSISSSVLPNRFATLFILCGPTGSAGQLQLYEVGQHYSRFRRATREILSPNSNRLDLLNRPKARCGLDPAIPTNVPFDFRLC